MPIVAAVQILTPKVLLSSLSPILTGNVGHTTLRTLNNFSLMDLQPRQQMASEMLDKFSSKLNPREKVNYSLIKESIYKYHIRLSGGF